MSIDHLMIDNINKYTFMNALDDYVETFLKKTVQQHLLHQQQNQQP